jgi:hypothetical protein
MPNRTKCLSLSGSVPQWLSARIEAMPQPDKYGLSQRLCTLPSAGANVANQ